MILSQNINIMFATVLLYCVFFVLSTAKLCIKSQKTTFLYISDFSLTNYEKYIIIIISNLNRAAVEAYFAEKKRLADEKAAAEAAAAAEKAKLDREANPTTEDLLKMILAEMKK